MKPGDCKKFSIPLQTRQERHDSEKQFMEALFPNEDLSRLNLRSKRVHTQATDIEEYLQQYDQVRIAAPEYIGKTEVEEDNNEPYKMKLVEEDPSEAKNTFQRMNSDDFKLNEEWTDTTASGLGGTLQESPPSDTPYGGRLMLSFANSEDVRLNECLPATTPLRRNELLHRSVDSQLKKTESKKQDEQQNLKSTYLDLVPHDSVQTVKELVEELRRCSIPPIKFFTCRLRLPEGTLSFETKDVFMKASVAVSGDQLLLKLPLLEALLQHHKESIALQSGSKEATRHNQQPYHQRLEFRLNHIYLKIFLQDDCETSKTDTQSAIVLECRAANQEAGTILILSRLHFFCNKFSNTAAHYFFALSKILTNKLEHAGPEQEREGQSSKMPLEEFLKDLTSWIPLQSKKVQACDISPELAPSKNKQVKGQRGSETNGRVDRSHTAPLQGLVFLPLH